MNGIEATNDYRSQWFNGDTLGLATKLLDDQYHVTGSNYLSGHAHLHRMKLAHVSNRGVLRDQQRSKRLGSQLQKL